MSQGLVISVDGMGGDQGPRIVAPGLAIAARAHPDVRFLVHGDEAVLRGELARHPDARRVCEIRPAEKAIAMDEKPAQALRRGKGSSLWNAVESIKAGEAAACVSAGNTGALMAISKLVLRMAADLERPAIVASWPTMRGITAVLDVGANVESHAAQLVEFAIMGAAFHRAAHGSARPTIGLLNVGSEEQKGHDEVREANRLLRENPFDLDYRGFVEGDDIAKGAVDVIVTDGFTGNVVLKSGEGLARFFSAEIKSALTAGPFSMAGALLASAALKRMRKRLDPARVNGGPLLGLNGIVVKSHGGTTPQGFASAVRVAIDLARSDFSPEIERNLRRLTAAIADSASAGAEGATV